MKIEEIKLRTELAQAKHYLNMKDVILLSGFSQTHLRLKIKEGKLKPIQHVPRGKLLFKSVDIKKFIDNGTM